MSLKDLNRFLDDKKVTVEYNERCILKFIESFDSQNNEFTI